MSDQFIRVRIKPLKSIGGIGDAGDVVMMSRADVEYYLAEGYIEILTPDDVPPMAPPTPEKANDQADHEIMKPQGKRIRKK